MSLIFAEVEIALRIAAVDYTEDRRSCEEEDRVQLEVWVDMVWKHVWGEGKVVGTVHAA
jgi:hypothetical protein